MVHPIPGLSMEWDLISIGVREFPLAEARLNLRKWATKGTTGTWIMNSLIRPSNILTPAPGQNKTIIGTYRKNVKKGLKTVSQEDLTGAFEGSAPAWGGSAYGFPTCTRA